MKNIIAIILTVCVLVCSYSAIAESNNDNSWLLNAETYEGEALRPLIDEKSIIPFYYVKDDGYENLFKTYQKGDLISQFDNELIEFVAMDKKGDQVYWVSKDFSKDGKYVAESGNAYKVFKGLFDYLAKLPENAEDVRFSWVESIRTPMFLYYRTDEGEFIVLNNTYTSKYTPNTIFEGGKAYSAEEFVDYCIRVKEARVAAVAEAADSREEEFIAMDENGDTVTITPKPAASPKATVKPEKTDKPEKTVKPTEIPTTEPTAIPTASPIPQTLIVEGGEEIKVNICGKAVAFPDAKPFIDENDRTQVPVRAVAEMLDCKVDWDGEIQTVTITKNGEVITLVIGTDVITKNGEQVKMDTKAIISEERTYIPIRFAAEALGLEVEYK